MYCVLRGRKIFTLLPPSDAPFLDEQPFRQGVHRWEGQGRGRSAGDHAGAPEEGTAGGPGSWTVDVEADSPAVNWVDALDEQSGAALPAALGRSPAGRRATPLVVEVRAGECLYLPAQWFHRVEQVGVTVAVNWWRDMSFGPQYVLLQFLRTLTVRPPSLEAAFAREAREALEVGGAHEGGLGAKPLEMPPVPVQKEAFPPRGATSRPWVLPQRQKATENTGAGPARHGREATSPQLTH